MRSARSTMGILYLVAAFSFAGTAFARDDDPDPSDLTRDGWYFGAQWNMGLEDWSRTATTAENSQGLSVYLGWRFLKSWGVDFQYEWQDDFAPTISDKEGTANAHVITANARYYIPFIPFERVQPFALAGFGLMQATGTDGDEKTKLGDFALRFGGGLDLYLTKNWAIETSGIYVQSTGDLRDQSYWSIGAGLQYRFAPHIY